MRAKISKRTVGQLSAAGQNQVLWDAEIKSFGIRCRSSGAAGNSSVKKRGRPGEAACSEMRFLCAPNFCNLKLPQVQISFGDYAALD